MTALRELAAIFHYGTLVDKMLRNRTVTGLRDHGHRERLLRDTNLTLQKAIDICRANGWVTRLGSQTAFTYASEKKKTRRTLRDMRESLFISEVQILRLCATAGNCPAYGQVCTKFHVQLLHENQISYDLHYQYDRY